MENKLLGKARGDVGDNVAPAKTHLKLVAITTATAATAAVFTTTAATTTATVFTARTTVTGAASAARTLLFRAGNVNRQGAISEGRTVHGLNRLLSLFRCGKGDKRKPT